MIASAAAGGLAAGVALAASQWDVAAALAASMLFISPLAIGLAPLITGWIYRPVDAKAGANTPGD